MHKKELNIADSISKFGVYFIIVILIVVGVLISSEFLKRTNLMNIIEAVAFLGIIASGMALVTYCGQLVDLSVPSVIALSGLVSILMLPYGIIISTIAAIVAGSIIGLINGFVVGKLKANTVVWTLAVSFVLTGLIRVIFGSTNIYLSEGSNAQIFEGLSRYRIFGYIPISVVVMLCTFNRSSVFGQQNHIR